MESLIENLGVDWKLLLAQVVNFFVLLVVLRLAVYKPLLDILAKRQKKIEVGLDKAREADERLASLSRIELEKVKVAEERGREIIHGAEAKAREEMRAGVQRARDKENELLEEAARRGTQERVRILEEASKEAAHMVKDILLEVVEIAPEAIDEALIKKVASTPRRT